MAIRKDLDDMLNSLRGSTPEKAAPSKVKPVKNKSVYDNMSVEDLLNALTVEKKPSLAENILNELDGKEDKASAEAPVKPVPQPKPVAAPTQKKKVVITGELPDYEELLRQEEEKKRQERLRAENFRMNLTGTIPEPEVIHEPEMIPEPEVISEPEQESEVEPISVQEEISEEIAPELPETEDVPEPEQISDSTSENQTSKKKKKGLFSKKSKKNYSEEESDNDDIPEADAESGDLFNNDSAGNDEDNKTESATDLIEAALAAINGISDAVEPIVTDENTADVQPENEDEETPEQNDAVSGLIEDIRENAANAIAELDEISSSDDEEAAEISESDESSEYVQNPEEENTAEESEQKEPPRKGKITSVLSKILDEDPETLIDVKKEKIEGDEEKTPKKKKIKRNIFAVLGVIFTIFAVIGIVATVGWGIRKIRGFATGEAKKDGFTELVYPVVIMDIESFDKPSDLTSEQIITASIWSIIMNDEKLEKYPVNVAGGDVILISAYDIEAEAVALFGPEHAEFVHTTVGPMTSRFYYDPEKGVYNVPVHPIVFTYKPEIKSIEKSGNDYTITVDYIDERPSWMEDSVSKSVEFHVTEKSDGTYQFNSMKILFVKNNL
ncbi:MAG: hypothetical protein IKK47_08490 [Ruminococcus sp.]|nr:hypothetical protein [Ruminococcus sp.]